MLSSSLPAKEEVVEFVDLGKDILELSDRDPPSSAEQGRGGGEIKLSGCLNDVFIEHQTALFTMLIDPSGGHYTTSTVKLLQSAKRHTTVPFSGVVLELKEKPLHPSGKARVQAAGWKVCTVNRIGLAKPGARKRYMDQFTKFALWGMVELDTVVYLDSDMYVIGDISGLFATRIPKGKKIAATPDSLVNKRRSRFNMGAFVLHPNSEDYNLLMSYQKGERDLVFNVKFAEQAFLNALWEEKWYELDRKYNALTHFQEVQLWRDRYRTCDFSVIHYTDPKPWVCPYEKAKNVREACRWWLENLSPVQLSKCADTAIDGRAAVWAAVAEASDVPRAVRVLRDMKRHATAPFPSVLMVPASLILPESALRRLSSAGWSLCQVENPKKDVLLDVTELATIVYVDLDHPVKGDVTPLLGTDDSSESPQPSVKAGFKTLPLVYRPGSERRWVPRAFPEARDSGVVRLPLCTETVEVPNTGTVLFSELLDVSSPTRSALAAKELLKGVKHASDEPITPVLLLPESLPSKDRKKLASTGWSLCFLQGPSLITELWGMVGVDTAVYLSPESVAVGDVTDLFLTRLPQSMKVGATLSYSTPEEFSSRVLLLHPNQPDYHSIRETRRATGTNAPTDALLNTVFSGVWKDLGFRFGADVRYAAENPEMWSRERQDCRIITLANHKKIPWKPKLCRPMQEDCEWWSTDVSFA